MLRNENPEASPSSPGPLTKQKAATNSLGKEMLIVEFLGGLLGILQPMLKQVVVGRLWAVSERESNFPAGEAARCKVSHCRNRIKGPDPQNSDSSGATVWHLLGTTKDVKVTSSGWSS